MAVTTQMVKDLREATSAGILDCKKALEATDGNVEAAINYLREKGLAVAAKKAGREANEGLVKVWVDDIGRYGVALEVNCETDFVARTEDFQSLVDAILRQVVEEPSIDDPAALMERPFIDDPEMTVSEKLTQVVATVGENMVVRRFDRARRDGAGWVEGYTHMGDRIGVVVYVSAEDQGVAAGPEFRELVHDLALQIAAAAPRFIRPEEIPPSELEAERAIFQAQVAEDKKPDHIKERIVTGKLAKWYEQICLLHQPFIKENSMSIQQLIDQKSKAWGTPVAVEKFIRLELGEFE